MTRFLACFLAVLALGVPQMAEARGILIVSDEVQNLAHVAETSIPAPNGGTFSLCHRYDTSRIYWIAFGSSSQGYVLSDFGCDGSFYYDNPQLIADGFANGQIPGEIPASPRFTPMQIATGFTWPLILGVVVLFAVIGAIRSNRRYRSRSALAA